MSPFSRLAFYPVLTKVRQGLCWEGSMSVMINVAFFIIFFFVEELNLHSEHQSALPQVAFKHLSLKHFHLSRLGHAKMIITHLEYTGLW